MKRSLIYHEFIHSTIIGKHRQLDGRKFFETADGIECNREEDVAKDSCIE